MNSKADKHNGKILLRVPKSMPKRLKALAEQEGVSINQLIVLALTEKLKERERPPFPVLRLSK